MADTIEKKNWFVYCCNPFNENGHKVIKRLRPVTDWMCSINYDIKIGMKICDNCRKKLRMENNQDKCIDTSEPGASKIQEDDSEFISTDISLDFLNKSLTSLGESPIVKKKLRLQTYCKAKVNKIKTCLKETFLTAAEDESVSDNYEPDSEIISQLKGKFERTSSKSERLQILTVLPKSWSCKKIEEEFKVSNFMARKAKMIVQEKGILSTPDLKPGKTLSNFLVNLVREFYNSDDVSRQMPGKKDFVSVKQDGKTRVHLQKKLILGNLKEIYELFKTKYPKEKIGFSKFAELRPRNCILAGGSGTHSVCVCTTHQNAKLMFIGAKLGEIEINGIPLKSLNVCIAKILCNPPQPICYLNECVFCPGTNNFEESLLQKLNEEMIENITYKQWISVDRCNLETVTKNTNDFVEVFSEQLLSLKRHDFISRQQASFYCHMKEHIAEGEVVLTCDFAENYSFILQDEVQSFHWNNSQATLHPCVIYYKDMEGLKHLNFVFISDCLKHDTIAVHLFQRKLIAFLLNSEAIPNFNKIYYFSDGSAAQYKNRKNFINLCHHKTDFGLEAEWHFYATSHGKSVCDGLGGTVKRLAARASLQRPYAGQIMTPRQLFDWSKDNINSITFFYCPCEEYSEEEKILKERFDQAKPITGTVKLHGFIPISTTELETKIYSFSDKTTRQVIVSDNQDLTLEQMRGFVTCRYDNLWWLACILSVDLFNQEVKLTFLHPSGPTQSFCYPSKPDLLTVSANSILTKVDPLTVTGRTYSLTSEEMKAATDKLKEKMN